MTGRKTIVSLCMLCALVFSAIAAQGASAAGQTSFTCVDTASPKHFDSEHCSTKTGTLTHGHVAISANEITHETTTNANTNGTTTEATNSVLKETIAATNLELSATGVHGTGSLVNKETGGVMESTVENTLTFSGVTVLAPAGKGCKVFEDVEGTKTEGAEGVVKTKAVKGKTIVTGTTHEVQIEPASGTAFATFFITCTKGLGVPEALEGTWEITGSIKCPTNGATILCAHNEITTQNTLKGKGSKAGFTGATTLKAGAGIMPQPTQETHPVSVTTTL